MAAAPLSESPIHGNTHWQRVAALGLALAEGDPDIDYELVVLFAMTHDAMRSDDGRDPDHGHRAVPFVRHLGLALGTDRLARLCVAVARHSLGETTTDPTIGACWDADRLDLYRLGVFPRHDLLSTARADTSEMRGRARALQVAPPTWEAIFASFAGRS